MKTPEKNFLSGGERLDLAGDGHGAGLGACCNLPRPERKLDQSLGPRRLGRPGCGIDGYFPILDFGGSELRLHPLAVFVAVFGGRLAFGIAGVILGPVTLAITVTLLELWQPRAANRLR